jgi:hypothetical protein
MALALGESRWLAVHRHPIRGLPTPDVLMLQHHLVGGATRIVAPLARGAPPALLLAPRVMVEGDAFTALILDMASVPARLILAMVPDAQLDEDAVTTALDATLRGYPAGLPIA